ncbi:ligase-associated DNA damage response endonuclease PdeM [Marinovum sp.]|uniref:ligase-associated DNA damage response endonuclease PdeM n=1 Tax=Marinovum sp. TaxID=2024839 RepID=UPI002B268B12|nr:ligase-associated DNA damage response endonuclease PdeM [Marinovum sp.]
MNTYPFTFAGAELVARPSGALHWPEAGLLCVSDLHLGKSARQARRNGVQLPPYDVEDTLARLEAEVEATQARVVICLGDSFDDLQAFEALPPAALDWITRLQAGRRWIWIEGNHDPGPVALAGDHLAQFRHGGLSFRHIAGDAAGEVSGHYHPKLRLRAGSRACFLVDAQRLIMPAFGTYTGGLRCDDPALDRLMGDGALAILTGARALAVPMRQNRSGRAASRRGR